jgi:hypothetical protein
MREMRDGTEGITSQDIIALDAGRPVRHEVLRRVYTQQDVDRALIREKSDLAVLRRSAASEPQRVRVVSEMQKSERPKVTWLYTTREDDVLADKADLRDRIIKALQAGNPRVRPADLAMLDTGRIRAVVFEAVAGPNVALGNRIADRLRAAGIDLAKAVGAIAARRNR